MTLREYFERDRGGLSPLLFSSIVENALQEDLGRAGDITTEAIFDSEHQSSVTLRSRENGILAGLPVALRSFCVLDPTLQVEIYANDGDKLAPQQPLVKLSGNTRALLTGERVALNLVGHLSGIATRTHAFVALLEGLECSVVDTRKTLPGLRALQKYAVRVGGGKNHRFGLDDCVLIKDNHVAAAGSITNAVQRVRQKIGHTVKIELEVDTLEQFREAIELGVDIILLDNFSPTDLRTAVTMRNAHSLQKPLLETSGRVTEETIRALAETGVDLISIGGLTHSVKNFDIGSDSL